MARYSLLIVDDDEFVVEDIATSLDSNKYEIDRAFCLESAFDIFRLKNHQIVIADLQLKESREDGFVLLRRIKEVAPATEVMIITSLGDMDRAIKAMQLGAVDFMTKPFDPDQIHVRIDKVAERVQLATENERLRSEIQDRYDMVGASAVMMDLKRKIALVARSNSRVLITGPNGSGKELIARAVHSLSSHADGPFITVNCAAIPDSLFESELFGTIKGAFTGAVNKKGKFELASGGTLFLDEIADMSLVNQAKVLRVLEENLVYRVGSEKPFPIDVRIITATNKNLKEQIAAKEFREDLFYRLNVAPLEAIPLRKHSEDIPLLIENTLRKIGRAGDLSRYFVPEAVSYMKTLEWPGNIRQLQNTIENLMIFWEGEPVDSGMIKKRFCFDAPSARCYELDTSRPIKEAVNDFEREYIAKVIHECGGNITEVATRLDLQRPYLYEKMKKLGLERK